MHLLPPLVVLVTAIATAALPDLPDPVGRAGMMAAVLVDAQGREAILAAGGANFPTAAPWEGGHKVYHREILLLEQDAAGWRWRKIGELPAANAYAAFCASSDRTRLIIAGGACAESHHDAVWAVGIDGSVTRFGPPLPQPRAYAGAAVVGDALVVFGGSQGPADTAALPHAVRLALSAPEQGWRQSIPDPLWARIVPLAGAVEGALVWGGGCALEEHDGRPRRIYRDDLWRNDDGSRPVELRRLAGPLAGAAGPGVACRGGLLIVGGDDGSRGGAATPDHPGQSRRVLFIDQATGGITDVGEWPTPIATAPLLRLGDDLVTVSGESRPGVRTAVVSRWAIPDHLR